ncbi:MAG: S-layer homology domain-containing protein, partial [Acutalibacter sp.]|nr:S-layer homology domain-containing protein [Acutalibacter sp.]
IIEMGIPEVTPPVGKNLIYNGKAQELITAGSAVNGKILYSLSEEDPYSEDIPVETEPGTYTIWYKVLGDEGYVDLDPESVTATITRNPAVSSDDRDSSSGSFANCPKDETCPIWPYTDASTTAWYHDGVHYCIEKGLMKGYGNNIWGPSNSLSRAMLTQILYNREGKPAVSGNIPFTDVKGNTWYTKAVIWAEAKDVAEGYGNGRFGPNDPITREQLAAMLYRYEQSQGGGFQGNWMFQMDFNDVADISGWAYEAICWCNMKGIVVGRGDGALDPRGNATRAEAAAMIMRYFELNK